MAACKPVTAPLPSGAINNVDAQVNATLQAAHAAVVQYESDVTAGKHTPTAEEKSIVNKLVQALNVADPLFQQWHSALQVNPAAGQPQALADALTAVSQNLNSIQTLVKGN
jgi:hypothetical protein